MLVSEKLSFYNSYLLMYKAIIEQILNSSFIDQLM